MKTNSKNSQDSLPKQRTAQQNRSLWLFCTMLAEALNNAGLDQRKVLKPSYQIPWTKQAIHDHVWLPLQEAMYGTNSTMFLHKTEQIDTIHATIMRMLGEKWGLEYIAFPSDTELQEAKLADKPLER